MTFDHFLKNSTWNKFPNSVCMDRFHWSSVTDIQGLPLQSLNSGRDKAHTISTNDQQYLKELQSPRQPQTHKTKRAHMQCYVARQRSVCWCPSLYSECCISVILLSFLQHKVLINLLLVQFLCSTILSPYYMQFTSLSHCTPQSFLERGSAVTAVTEVVNNNIKTSCTSSTLAKVEITTEGSTANILWRQNCGFKFWHQK